MVQSLQSKFRAGRKSSRRDVFDTTSFYRTGESSPKELDEAVLSGVKPRPRSQVRSGVRRASPGAVPRARSLVPALDGVLGDGRRAAALGRAGGVPGEANGAGLLGAVLRRAGLKVGSTLQPVSAERRAGGPPVVPGAFLNKTGAGMREVPMMSPAPVPRPAAAPSASAAGQRRLGQMLREAAGRVGALLFDTELGAQFQAIEAMQDALKGRAAEQLREQSLRPTWA
jgi:hypothetical protein